MTGNLSRQVLLIAPLVLSLKVVVASELKVFTLRERFGVSHPSQVVELAYQPVEIVAKTCDLENVLGVYTTWPWEPARNASDRKICGSSVARSWAHRRMPFTIG